MRKRQIFAYPIDILSDSSGLRLWETSLPWEMSPREVNRRIRSFGIWRSFEYVSNSLVTKFSKNDSLFPVSSCKDKKKHKNALHQLENLYKIQEVIIQKATAMYGEPLALTLWIDYYLLRQILQARLSGTPLPFLLPE